MALLYFDGFTQYGAAMVPSTTTPVAYVQPGVLQGTAAGETPFITNLSASYQTLATINGEAKTWLLPGFNISGSVYGSFAYSELRQSPNLSSISGNYGMVIDTQKQLLDHKKLVVGFKIKYAADQTFNPDKGYWLPLIAFSSRPEFSVGFSSQLTCYALILQTNGRITLAPYRQQGAMTSALYPTNGNVGWSTDATPANTSYGASTFVSGLAGASPASPCTPTIDKLASNTVEVELTCPDGANTTVRVWVNNQLLGSITLAVNSGARLTRYLKFGVIPGAAYSSGTYSPDKTWTFIGYTDLYVLDGSGSTNNSRLGKVKVLTRQPVRDDVVQFIRPDTLNANVDVAGRKPPTVARSLTGNKVGDTDLYKADAFDFTNEVILAASVYTTGYKVDPTGNDIAPVLKIGDNKFVGPPNRVPISSTAASTKQAIFEVNPSSGLPFTKTDIDGSSFGVTVVGAAGDS